MDSYLALAEQVLRVSRRPLSAREILESGYALGIVPPQLFGQTQQKTLGARLSEDVLLRRDRSAFFRTEPGKFFLTEFLSDPAIPAKHRTPIVARRRERELQRGRFIAVHEQHLTDHAGSRLELGLSALHQQHFRYLDSITDRLDDELILWSFVMVTRGEDVLTYRHGRYREGRDAFLRRRSIGFFTPVVDIDRDLFDLGDHGAVASGVRAVVLDLDMPRTVSHDAEYQKLAQLNDFVVDHDGTNSGSLLAVIRFDCPSWFEPLTRRLAINDLAWMSLRTQINHIEDFDPWSQRVLSGDDVSATSKHRA